MPRMAHKLDTFPVTARTRYPWDEWFNGRIWELHRAADFPGVQLANFRSIVTSASIRHGVRVRTTVPDADTIVIQATGPR